MKTYKTSVFFLNLFTFYGTLVKRGMRKSKKVGISANMIWVLHRLVKSETRQIMAFLKTALEFFPWTFFFDIVFILETNYVDIK